MADNTILEGTLTSSGDTIHTDELTAATYKMATTKVIFGVTGNNDDYWAAGAGAVGTDVGRVTLASDDPAVVALQLIDNAVSGAGFNITQFGGVAVTLNTGVRDAGTQRVTIATNDVVPVTGTITAVTDITNTVTVDNGGTFAVQAVCTNAGTFAVQAVCTNAGTFAVQSTLQTGSNAIGKLAANDGVDIGDVDVTSISAGTNLIGDVGIQGRATGGLSVYYDNDLDETAMAVNGDATGTLYAIHVINTTAAPLYLQLFNTAVGSVTVGTTTPFLQFVIPGNADSDGAGFTFSVPQGIAFSTAITVACTTGSETAGAPGANACHCNLFYK